MNWGIEDFATAALLIGGTGLAYLLIVRGLQSKKQRLVAAAILVALLALVWAELAVGIID